MRSIVFIIGTCFVVTASATTPLPHSNTIDATVDDFMRIRCSTDGKDSFYEWHGKVFAASHGEKQTHIFDIVGMNVAKCLPNSDGSWNVNTREIQLYLDPSTKKVLHRWQNPWSNEDLPVAHVANNPVQNRYPAKVYVASIAGDRAIFNEDWPLTYPNPLAESEDFRPYGNQPLYQAVEMFKYIVASDDLRKEKVNTPSIPEVAISWTRTGPWLPWMKMGEKQGYLIYSAWGMKIGAFSDLPIVLRDEIHTRLPLYERAPTCWLRSRNETSWTYFKKHFSLFLEGARFPVPAPNEPDDCQ